MNEMCKIQKSNCLTSPIPSVVNTEYNTFMRFKNTPRHLESCETCCLSKAHGMTSIPDPGQLICPPLCPEHHPPLVILLIVIVGLLVLL